MSENIKKAAAMMLTIAFCLSMVVFTSADVRQGPGQCGAFTNIPDAFPGMFLTQKSDSRIVHSGLMPLIFAVIIAGFDGIKCVIISIYSKCGEISSASGDSLLRLGCLLQV